MAETPELKRIAENTRIQSNVSRSTALSFLWKCSTAICYELGQYRFINAIKILINIPTVSMLWCGKRMYVKYMHTKLILRLHLKLFHGRPNTG
jgi:hypothetical protein